MKKSLTASQFQRRLFAWFDQYGRKHLPWQQNKTAYRVWVSEIMLQQTQVATVIPYFERFIRSFPNIKMLAKADEDLVLHQWTGLGYYSRARNLHRAAQIVLEEYGGIFPNTLTDLITLPGIGLSTAGAILAIAFEQPATILDGNVKRVLARFYGLQDPINEKKTENKLWEMAIKLTPKKRVADYTQAMMDLGATICTRSKPQCLICPLASHCVAYREDLTAVVPAKKTGKPLPVRVTTLVICKHENYIWLHKRPAKGIWGGLFCLPEIEGKATHLDIKNFCLKNLQTPLLDSQVDFQALKSFRHTFTHYHLDIFPVLIHCPSSTTKRIKKAQAIWYNLIKPDIIGLPKPVISIIKSLKN